MFAAPYLPANRATRADVAAVPEPCYQLSKTGRIFQPVKHGILLDCVHGALRRRGLHVTAEAYQLTPNGDRMFGILNLESSHLGAADSHGDVSMLRAGADDFTLCLGLRNCNDKSAALGIVLGTSVLVCDNLMLSGDVQEIRRHTRFIYRDLPGLVDRAVNAAYASRERMFNRVEKYKRHHITSFAAHDLVCRAVRKGALPPSKVGAVLQHWHEPLHPEFEEPTVWSLQNAFTEAWKPAGQRNNLHQLGPRSAVLEGLLDECVGLN